MNNRQTGFGVIEIILVIIVVSVLGATGWYALHTKHQTDKILSQADKISQSIPKITSIKSFDDCQKSAGSKIQETFPEICITKSGVRFTNPAQQSATPPSQ